MIHAVGTALGEIIRNLRRTVRLTLYENRSRRSGMLLGRWWDLLSPLLQILIYWFVFSVGLGTQEKNGFPYHLWLMCGMMPWLALNSAILGASASIQQAASIIRNVRIPLSIIPMKAVVRAYYEHLWTMAILLIALLLGGVPVTWHYLELAYYLAASWVLLIGAALLTSSLTAVFRDFGELLQPLMRLLFYISSVVWAIDGLSPGLQRVMRLNPLVYIIEGYRKCLLYGEGFWSSPGQGAYFWLAALALFHFFKNLDLGSNRFINGLAGTTLGVYILHQVPVLRDFLWNGIFRAQAHHGSAAYTLLVIVLTFAGCAAIDTLRTRFIMQPLQRSRAFTALCAKGDALAAEIEKQSD